MAEEKKIHLSVVIPSYHSQKNLRKNLDAIKAQLTNDSVEVIVVDCSETMEVDDICHDYSFVKLIKEKERFNPGKGRNIGANVALGQYLMFIDADVILGECSIEAAIKHAKGEKKILGGALELYEDGNNDLASYVEHYYFNHESQSTRPYTKRKNLSSALMIFEKKLFLSVGGFKDIPRMQDTELTERLVKSGYDLHFMPDIVGYQIQDSKLSKVLKKISITGNNLYFIRYKEKTNYLSWFILIFMLPLLMLFKITRINLRNLKYKFSMKNIFMICPFMYICGIYWMMGLYKGLFSGAGIDSRR